MTSLRFPYSVLRVGTGFAREYSHRFPGYPKRRRTIAVQILTALEYGEHHRFGYDPEAQAVFTPLNGKLSREQIYMMRNGMALC